MDANVPGTPCWIELVTPDRAKAVEFYGALFGWTAGEQSEEFGGYSMFMIGDQPVAGLMPEVPELTGPPVWAVYLATDDAAKLAARATELGGSVLVEPMAIADLGTMVVVTDASGLGHCGWQTDTFPGYLRDEVEGAPVWAEAYSKDFTATKDFLSDAFGWTPQLQGDTDDFRYATNTEAGSAAAGLMDAASWGDDFEPAWSAYIKVDDAAAAAQRVTELGGTVTQGPDDTPYGILTEIADPNGQRIKLIQQPASD